MPLIARACRYELIWVVLFHASILRTVWFLLSPFLRHNFVRTVYRGIAVTFCAECNYKSET